MSTGTVNTVPTPSPQSTLQTLQAELAKVSADIQATVSYIEANEGPIQAAISGVVAALQAAESAVTVVSALL